MDIAHSLGGSSSLLLPGVKHRHHHHNQHQNQVQLLHQQNSPLHHASSHRRESLVSTQACADLQWLHSVEQHISRAAASLYNPVLRATAAPASGSAAGLSSPRLSRRFASASATKADAKTATVDPPVPATTSSTQAPEATTNTTTSPSSTTSSTPTTITTSSSSNSTVVEPVKKDGTVFSSGASDARESCLTITIVGASGDLARKKIFPALFALYYEGCLPKNFQIFGYARSKMDDAQLRNVISSTLTCRIDKREECGTKMEDFLERVFYQSGQYSSVDGFKALSNRMDTLEAGMKANRLFYLSIPPNVFVDVAKCASLGASSTSGYTRIIVEKPFGRDSESSAELTKGLAEYLDEDQIYRIDHYLGKELVENLLVLRFSNLVFEPLWTRQYIRNVQLIFSEDFGTDGRGGYFDNYGIIRDIMQNHLLQILTLFAMEPPVSLSATDIINEKVKVLRSMKPLRVEDVVVAQYKGHTSRSGMTYPGYTEDPTVPSNSITPTFAAAALFIDNARWDGVPFLMKAGKALHTKRAEIRVQFRHVPGNLYKSRFGTDLDQATNELVIRLQPDEAIYLKINNKVPGLGFRLDRSTLNLQYFDQYKKELPDAYERLLLDAIDGDKRLFIRSDELEHAWALFTPLLKELEAKQVSPELYPYGSRGPIGAHYLAAKYGVRWGDMSV